MMVAHAATVPGNTLMTAMPDAHFAPNASFDTPPQALQRWRDRLSPACLMALGAAAVAPTAITTVAPAMAWPWAPLTGLLGLALGAGSCLWFRRLKQRQAQQQAQSALQWQQERTALRQAWELAQASAGLGQLQVDLVQDLAFCDAATLMAWGLGHTPSQRPWSDLLNAVHPDDRAGLLTALQAVPSAQHPQRVALRVLWADGSLHHL